MSEQERDPEEELAAKKKLMLRVGAAVLAVTMLAGIGIYIVLDDGEAKPSGDPLVTASGSGEPRKPDGGVRTDPAQIQLAQLPDGTFGASVNIVATAADFRVTAVGVSGDPGLTLDNTCALPQQVLPMEKPCTVTIRWKPDPMAAQAAAMPLTPAAGMSAAPGQPSAQSTTAILSIAGTSTSAAGATRLVESKVPIMLSGGPQAQGQVAMQGQVGADGLPLPPPATGAIAPYGAPQGAPGTPLQPGAGGAPAQVAAGGGAPNGAPAAPVAPAMSLRDQYILARRQAAFTGTQARYAPQAPQQAGTWSDIKVPTATSTLPQDMSRVLTMDRVITAVLVRTYDSRSSQQVIAQVDRNVYGAAGRNILIPRGSTIIGTMSSGAQRAVVNWTQIIRPDGARFVMKASGGDAMGQAGVPGYTNNRNGARYGAILLGTLLKAGVAYGTGAASTESVGGIGATTAQNNGAVITNIVSQDLNQIVQQIVAQQSKIQPITVVPAGTRMTIFPQQDLAMFAIQRETIVRSAYPRTMNGGAQTSSFEPGAERGEDGQTPQQQRQQGQQGNQPAPRATSGVGRRIDPQNTSLGDRPPW